MIETALASVCRLVAGATVEWRCDLRQRAADLFRQPLQPPGLHRHLVGPAALAAPPRAPVAGRDYWEQGRVRRYLASEVFRAVLVERRSAGAGNAVDPARRWSRWRTRWAITTPSSCSLKAPGARVGKSALQERSLPPVSRAP